MDRNVLATLWKAAGRMIPIGSPKG